MRIPNFSYRDMAIHSAVDLEKSFQTLCSEARFQVEDCQLKAIRELAKHFDARIQLPNRDVIPTPPALIIKQSSKILRVKYHTASPPRVDSYK